MFTEKWRPSTDVDYKTLRSYVEAFHFETHCLLCGNVINKAAGEIHPDRSMLQFSNVMSLVFEGIIL